MNLMRSRFYSALYLTPKNWNEREREFFGWSNDPTIYVYTTLENDFHFKLALEWITREGEN